MRILTRTGAFAVAAAATVMVTAMPAAATGDHYNSKLHQEVQGETPITAADFQVEDQEDVCGNVALDKDGWHFIAPGSNAEFVKLVVEFENAGTVTVTEFGPPDAKHAYVATEPGDELLSGKAMIEGGNGKDFNLSHTCPADEPDPTDPTDPTDADPTDADPTDADPTDADPTDADPTDADPTDADPADPTDADPADPTDADPADPTDADPSDPTDTDPVGTNGGDETTPDGGGDLADTGASAPVVALSLGAAALLGAGAYLAVRRRNSGSAAQA